MKELSSKELRSLQLDILKEIHNFCSLNNIRYSLAYGTLIGAVRHKGYIPWDDDIDICMLREDYDRFVKLFNVDRNDSLRLRSLETDSTYIYAFAKVENTSTILEEFCNYPLQIGVNVDVFPIDGVPDDINARQLYYKKLKRRQTLCLLKNIKIVHGRNTFKNIFLSISQFLLSTIPIRKLVDNVDNIIDKENCTSSFVCELSQSTYGLKGCFLRSDMDSFVEMEFEGFPFLVMNGYHDYLSHIYGDYMQLPPIEKQISHHTFKVFVK